MHKTTLTAIAFTLVAAAGQAVAAQPTLTTTSDIGSRFSTTVEHYYRDSRHDALNRYNGTGVTRFSLRRQMGEGTLHYGNTRTTDEIHHDIGVSSGRVTLAYFRGSGTSFSKTGDALYRDLNHYFFHGGNQAPFSFQGGGLDLEVNSGVSAQFAGVRMKSPGLEDRNGYYAGVQSRRWGGGVFGLERGRQRIGHGFNLSFTGEHAGFEYQEVRRDTGAHQRRFGFSWRGRRGPRLSLDVEQVRNPLFASADEHRVMFRLRRSWGGPVWFNAAEEAPAESEEKKSYGSIVAIGVGVGAVALAASSGDSGGDSRARFTTADAAAIDALNAINPTSVAENREHGGWIFRNADGSFGSTNPVAGEVASVNIGNPFSAVPTNTTAAASYHTHGGPDPRYDNENFSPQDILSDVLVGLDGYLGTPAGFAKKHVVATGQILVLGRIAN